MLAQIRVFWMGIVLALVLATWGCARKHPYFAHDLPLGNLSVSTAGNWVEGQFRCPGPPTNAALEFVIHDICQPGDEVQKRIEAFKRVGDLLYKGSLRLRLQLFRGDSTNDFYCAEFSADANGNYMLYPGFGKCDIRGCFNRIELLPLGVEANLLGDATVTYHLRHDEEVLRDRKLIPGADYRLKLTVLNPVAVTNRFEVLLFAYLPYK
jgi:hypothetical protein